MIMTRKKVKLAYIANDSARKATFKKRKKGMLKKVKELTTLCDVEACAIIYSPYESAPEVYPSPLGAQRVLGRFRKMPEMEQSKKMVNQEGFLRQRIAKANEQLKKLKKDNRDKDVARIMFRALTSPAPSRSLHSLSLPDLADLSTMVDRTLADITARLRILAEDGDEGDAEALPNPPPDLPRAPKEEQQQLYDQEGDDVAEAKPAATAAPMEKKPQWFMDLMMTHQDVSDQNNFPAFGDAGAGSSGAGTGSSSQWGGSRVFP